MITIVMVVVFLIGYSMIALEYKTEINKSAVSILLGVALWILYILGVEEFVPSVRMDEFTNYLSQNPLLRESPKLTQMIDFAINGLLVEHLGATSEIIFFLMGAMTIVEIIDKHGGFNFVNSRIRTRDSRKLLWVVMLMTFFMSSVLDNLTTAIVMIMVIRKLIDDAQARWMYAGIIIVAANSGGAFSPIGDVTTILLWINGNVSTTGILKVGFIPAFISAFVPTLIVSRYLKGDLSAPALTGEKTYKFSISHKERIIIFIIGVGGLIMVPVFKSLTGLPPFMGVMAALGVLWCYTEVLYREKYAIEEDLKQRVSKVIKQVDMSTVLFFFGILLSVAALQEAGVLSAAGRFLDEKVHNVYGVNFLIGLLSSVVDNGSLVAGAIGMYPLVSPEAAMSSADPAYMMNFVQDGEFWNLLAYCAGVGGSLMIIGSAAGVMVMGLEKVTFNWYFKRFSWIVFIGYLSGIACYYLQAVLFHLT